jgi:endonuclease/exonuclease/phosphatase (EEP) superfamily protein YafD
MTSSNSLRLNLNPWGLLTAAGAVVCAATMLGFLGRYSWFLDLCSHFRVQYLVGLLVLAGLCFAARRRRTAAACVAFAGINAACVAPLYFSRQTLPPGAGPALSAMQLNVNTREGNPALVKAVIDRTRPDIIVLEELSSAWIANLAPITNVYPYSCLAPREDNFGIGLYSRFPIIGREVVRIGAAGVPSILATLDIGHGKLRVVATHPLPPAGKAYSRLRNDQLEDLADVLHAHRPVLLLGDLNATPWNYYFHRLLDRSGLLDSSRGYGVHPTWHRDNPLFAIPIDHCLHSPDIAIISRTVGDDVGSDHRPLVVEFAIMPGAASARSQAQGSPER